MEKYTYKKLYKWKKYIYRRDKRYIHKKDKRYIHEEYTNKRYS